MKSYIAFITFLLASFTAFEEAKANDGKIDIKDAPLLLGPAMLAPSAIGNVKVALAEWKSATTAEREAANAQIKGTFDIANDELEKKIEAGVGAMTLLGEAF